MRHLLVPRFNGLIRVSTSSILQTRSWATRISHFDSRQPFHSSPSRSVIQPYLLADIGEGITECRITQWLVKAGDEVNQFDPICEVQSDKASVEITSRYDGVITKLHYEVDDMAIVGKPILDIDIDADEPPQPAKLEEEDGGSVFQAEEAPVQDSTTSVEGATMQNHTTAAVDNSIPNANDPLPAAPAVRRMLKDLGLDVSEIRGSGKGGRVLKEDVQRHASSIKSEPELLSRQASDQPGQQASDQIQPLSPTESQMFKIMTNSLKIPHFGYTNSVDFTSLNNLRRGFSSRLQNMSYEANHEIPNLTALSTVMKAVSQAFIQHPKLNAFLDTESDPEKPRFVIKRSHNFGFAVDTPTGLLVPVIKDVQNHSILSLAAEIKRLGSLAANGKLAPGDMKGATFTVSNIGSIGGSAVSPIIVAPMVAIMAIGKVEQVPVFVKDDTGETTVAKRDKVVLSWSADHRILDGATVARCAETVGTIIENIGELGLALT